MKNPASLHAKLLHIARERGLEFQLLLNRFAGEQFLVRLSQSQFRDHFVFKGGSLLAYLIETERKTRDLDFTIKHLNPHLDAMMDVIRSILAIPSNDYLEWNEIEGSELIHPNMDWIIRAFVWFAISC